MAMEFVEAAVKVPLPSMDVEDTNAFLKDFFVSEDPDKTIVCGFYRQESGQPLKYTYTYHEMKIVVDGELWVTDETGRTVKAKPGDIFYFRKGSTVTFDSPTYGVGFFCGQRQPGEA
jgi:ethanolamine utilization protein EutQ (cupin superfamily)